ncbi:MAG: hypothetical protein C4521_02430 [Actinobacteria bacterium]|jgi:hypothetical protein|nr:MAG: hypothetical protein C4521_02430 [Actinomycetota bacterium]
MLLLGSGLVALSVLLYALHYAVFQDATHIFIYGLGDLAFLPIEVLLVTVIVHELLDARQKRMLLSKLNMLIGAFFSEAGTRLLAFISDSDPNLDAIRSHLIVETDWPAAEFEEVSRRLKAYEYRVEIDRIDLPALRDFLVGVRGFMTRLLENPNLLEHETFTELLWAVFHLTEELDAREDLGAVSGADAVHLQNDVSRAYGLLVREWLAYMRHLKDNYPYLFSLAIRTNPFDRQASVVVTS